MLLEAEISSWYTVYQCENVIFPSCLHSTDCMSCFTQLLFLLLMQLWWTEINSDFPKNEFNIDGWLISSLTHMLVRKLFQLYLALCLRRTRMSSLYSPDCAVRGGIGLPSLTLQGPVKQIAHWGPALEVGRLPSFMHACSSDELVLNFDVPPPPPTWCCGEIHSFTQTCNKQAVKILMHRIGQKEFDRHVAHLSSSSQV